MKKAKIMLMAISVLTITGGVLAFKAKSANFPRDLCVTDPSNSTGICGTFSHDYTVSDNGIDVSYSPAPVGVNTDAKCTTMQCTLEGLVTLDKTLLKMVLNQNHHFLFIMPGICEISRILFVRSYQCC